jgi:hypothetical protein
MTDEKVYVDTAPVETPSIRTFAIRYPDEGVIVYVRDDPAGTVAVPTGEIVPPLPADAEMVKGTLSNTAAIE